ncbi:hypothetical protein [Lysobacter sp. CA199]|uniref:hypothetical protein n=1 Tax=Lysobacter sp. CA199 TaxID=3455608 RepID=UPI003F8D00D6
MRFESHHPRRTDAPLSARGFGALGLRHPNDSILSPDALDLDSELSYWRNHYRGLIDRPGLRFGDYEPAIKLGLDAYMRGHGRSLDEMEDELRACYKRVRALSRLDWDEARRVVAAACERVHRHRHAQ